MDNLVELINLFMKYDSLFKNVIITILMIGIILTICIHIYTKVIPIINKTVNTFDNRELLEEFKKQQDKIDSLEETVNKLVKTLDVHIDESKLDTRVAMKAQLMQTYHTVHNAGYILECELDTFKDIIERYEMVGGNGKMHEVIKPYIEQMGINHMYVSETDAELHKEKHGSY